MHGMTKCHDRSPQDAARKHGHEANGQSARGRDELSSEQLFGDVNEIYIRHAGEQYTLRRTSKGKLILTK